MMNWAAQGNHYCLKRVKARRGQWEGSVQAEWASVEQNNTSNSSLPSHTASDSYSPTASVSADRKQTAPLLETNKAALTVTPYQTDKPQSYLGL